MIASPEFLDNQNSDTRTNGAVDRPAPGLPVDVSTLVVRRMRPEDVPGIMRVEAVSFGRHHWVDDSFHNEMNNPIGRYFSLLHPDGAVLGYAGFWHIVDEAHVTTVAVDPAYRGNALGELLFLQLLEHCYNLSLRWVTLEVRTSNYAAQNLYYKYGLQSVGTRPKYYQDNQEDALIMTSPSILDEKYRALYNENKAVLKQRLGGFPIGYGQ